MRARIALACLLAAAASPAFAHRVSGTIYCDRNGNQMIDAADTPVHPIFVRAVSQDVMPGQTFTTGNDIAGFYVIGLPQRSDRYRVDPVSIPPTFSIVVPAAGFYDVQIVSGTSDDIATGLDFLLVGCAPTTTSTSTTTSSTVTSTTSSPTMPTTTTTSTTTTTTIPVCLDCSGTPFLVARDGKFNNSATIGNNVGANSTVGRIRLGRNVVMPDATSVTGDTVIVGNASSVARVLANSPSFGTNAVARDGTGTPTLPVVEPFCPLPAIASCNGNDVQVEPGFKAGPLAPGVYGRLWVLDGGSIMLSPGDFTFCDIKTGRGVKITTLGPARLDVTGSVKIGSGSQLGPAQGADPVVLNVQGRTVRLSQNAVANAAVVAPDARISFGRNASLFGCFCTDRAKSDKRISLICLVP